MSVAFVSLAPHIIVMKLLYVLEIRIEAPFASNNP